MTSFGDDCDVLLNWLGFKKTSPDPDGDVDHELWQLPRPPPLDPFTTEGLRVLLEDVMEELYATMRRQPEDQKALVKHRPPEPEAFDQKMYILLGIVDYEEKHPKRRRSVVANDHLYAGLGAMQEFTTELLMYAFRRQTEWDPAGSAYYYDCLKALASKYPNDEMNMQLAILASEGFISRAEVTDAYKYFGFQQNEIGRLSDHDILGHFESRLDSSHKNQETDIREKLKIIGKARGSSLLTNAAENGKWHKCFVLPLVSSIFDCSDIFGFQETSLHILCKHLVLLLWS
jgi:ubiquitin carboxyl-terminal hydrolase 25/28